MTKPHKHNVRQVSWHHFSQSWHPAAVPQTGSWHTSHKMSSGCLSSFIGGSVLEELLLGVAVVSFGFKTTCFRLPGFKTTFFVHLEVLMAETERKVNLLNCSCEGDLVSRRGRGSKVIFFSC
jgi:hypothetical protein